MHHGKISKEDNALVIDMRTAASDIDSPVLTAQIVTGPAHGTLTQNLDGSYSYTPDANYNGTDSFTYKVNDAAYTGDPSALDSNIATVSLTIGAVNDAPTVTTLEDTAYVFQTTDFGFSDAVHGPYRRGDVDPAFRQCAESEYSLPHAVPR